MKTTFDDLDKKPGKIQEDIAPQSKLRNKGGMARVNPCHREGKN